LPSPAWSRDEEAVTSLLILFFDIVFPRQCQLELLLPVEVLMVMAIMGMGMVKGLAVQGREALW
jgi:hypothetical protein